MDPLFHGVVPEMYEKYYFMIMIILFLMNPSFAPIFTVEKQISC